MRAEIRSVRKNDYEFCFELDTGGSPKEEIVCWIYKDGQPLLKLDKDVQVRKYFDYNKFNKQHMWRFIDKFVNDKNYRDKYIMEVE